MFKMTPMMLTLALDKLLKNLQDEGEGLLENLTRFVDRQKRGGMSEEAIQKALLAEFDNPESALFGLFTRSFGDEMGELVDDIATQERDLEMGIEDDPEETWIAQLINSCPDCVALHGKTQKRSEWEAEGGPNVRSTVCTYKGICHCMLIVTSLMSAQDKKDFSEPIKLQRSKINEYRALKKKAGVSLSAGYAASLVGQANNPDSVVQ